MSEQPHYLGHRKRLKKRILEAGFDGMHEYELLELLLGYAIPRRDTKPLAKQLIQQFEGLGGVLNAPQDELQKISGIGEHSAVLVKLLRGIYAYCLSEKLAHRIPLTSVHTVVEFAQAKLAYLSYEAFMVVYLNTQNEVLAHEIIHEGTIDHALIYPRRVAESALRRNAASIILVHNHPSGHPRPSEADSQITRVLTKAMKLLDINVIDHIIVGRAGYFSFAEKGIL